MKKIINIIPQIDFSQTSPELAHELLLFTNQEIKNNPILSNSLKVSVILSYEQKQYIENLQSSNLEDFFSFITLLKNGYDHRFFTQREIENELSHHTGNNDPDNRFFSKFIMHPQLDFHRKSIFEYYQNSSYIHACYQNNFFTIIDDSVLTIPVIHVSKLVKPKFNWKILSQVNSYESSILTISPTTVDELSYYFLGIQRLLKKEHFHISPLQDTFFTKTSMVFGKPESLDHRIRRNNLEYNFFTSRFYKKRIEKNLKQFYSQEFSTNRDFFPAFHKTENLLLSDISGFAVMSEKNFNAHFIEGRFTGFQINESQFTNNQISKSYMIINGKSIIIESQGNVSFETSTCRGIREKLLATHESFSLELIIDSFFHEDVPALLISTHAILSNIPNSLEEINLLEIPLFQLTKDTSLYLQASYPDEETATIEVPQESSAITVTAQKLSINYKEEIFDLNYLKQNVNNIEATKLLFAHEKRHSLFSISPFCISFKENPESISHLELQKTIAISPSHTNVSLKLPDDLPENWLFSKKV